MIWLFMLARLQELMQICHAAPFIPPLHWYAVVLDLAAGVTTED